jgi:hypothetical protein
MNETCDWSNFYDALCKHGPSLLIGIDDDTRELIEELALTTDTFWSDGLQDLLGEGANNGDVRAGVLSVLELWRENVLQAISSDFGIELGWKAVSIDTASTLIDKLVEAGY